MSSIPQNYFVENDLIDCVQRFFSKHHVGRLLARCNGMKEKGVSSVSLLRYNSATFLSEEVCICSSGLALLRRRFPRTLSTVSLILQKQTGFVLLLFLQLILSIMTFVIWQIRKEKMSLSLMTAFSTVPAVRKRNWDQKFLTTRICISKRASGCLL